MSNYPGRNLRERRGSLVKVKFYWPSLSSMGEVLYREEGETVCHEKKGTEGLRLEAVE
jgi:hypothetical protein